MEARPEFRIPNKLYFRIGEVAHIVGVKPYVLRYWETEFPDIRPAKSKSGQRLYKRRDVDFLLTVRSLLYEERFTINGARKRMKELNRENNHAGDGGGYPTKHGSGAQIPLLAQSPIKEPFPEPSKPLTENRKLLLKLKQELQLLLNELNLKP